VPTEPGNELVPFPAEVRLPSAREFGRMLREHLEAEIVRVRAERGEVGAPEDTHALIRSLQGFTELAAEYARGWTGAGKIAQQEIEEELLTGVGEQDGTPNGAMNVTDHDGTTIRVAPKMANEYDIDVNALYPALAEVILATTEIGTDLENACLDAALALPEDRPAATAERNAVIVRALILAMTELPSVGAFTPQVTKVKALAAELGRLGDDRLASTVTGAIRKTEKYTGVKIERKEPKK
jgi:hypothetical protein